MKIIPAIDLKDGKCVRLFQGEFDQSTEYSNDPVAVARRFSALDVQDLHVVDLDGARSGEQANHVIVSTITEETGLDVQLGGGIRDRDAVEAWLNHGVARCVIGSMAITDAGSVREWLREFGADRIVLALDVRVSTDGTPILTTHGWTRDTALSLWECIDQYQDVGLKHVLCTDVSRDGAMAGPNVALYKETARRYPNLVLQASGGVRHVGDLEELRAHGIPAAISGRALLDGAITSAEVAAFRQSA
ncbi:MAG: 1-(5-phosphoribosyl)-5-[(5-phosphoribosylamino)methylideneamino]imidazole-4-carboxamide isomerase [Gammaproteobacteria bacterium]|nr:1-(5-phosphoribosyl)-5-[(5-phosphoribosylamino)methylideneamino]imidazole-4-carboxamide isomerase [Gammaproteobacteria bacterium]